MNNTSKFLPGNWADKAKQFAQDSKKYEQAAKKREQQRAKKFPVELKNAEKPID